MTDRSTRYTLLTQLGAGSFGTVWQATALDHDTTVAIKQIDLESSDEDITEVQKEINLLAACDSPYITRYYESFISGFQLWIVMEYLSEGSLHDIMKSRGCFSEAETAVVCRETLCGLSYLHSNGKIHRDIKSANILLAADGRVKLADFGVAAQLSSNLSRRNTFVGTPYWMAPEVIRQADYDTKADVWSLGITTIELLLGEPPLSEFHPMRAIFLIPRSPPPRLTGAFTPPCREFVSSCLQKDVRLRPSVTDLLSHPFVHDASSNEAFAATLRQEEPKTDSWDDGDAQTWRPSPKLQKKASVTTLSSVLNSLSVSDDMRAQAWSVASSINELMLVDPGVTQSVLSCFKDPITTSHSPISTLLFNRWIVKHLDRHT